ncbi:MAG: patatin-like phospholipase family protein [Polyangiaceae bacterium]|nr:patatin-like phospholipase family protein [Polyangiaceae bacterium]
MPKRSLILAGGGIKVAFQAGVLQVWLDEAGLTFDHADGASGGTFNLAMWCQGMTGTQIADAWRRTRPAEGVSLNAPQFQRLLWARSLFTLDAYRRHVFPAWGLDWEKIRASRREASFNVFNFTNQELQIWDASQMDEDRLCACVSLPMWFPPVVIGDETFIDAVYVTDGNVEEAIRRGADEIWAIWTVSTLGTWNDGFVANYFQIIEAAANGRFKIICDRIETNNRAIAAGNDGEFGRPIALHVLKAEVPMHYLMNFNQDRLVECVNLGVRDARRWCNERGVGLTPAMDVPPTVRTVTTSLSFREEMKGYLMPGEVDPREGFDAGRAAERAATLRVTVVVDDVDRFVTEPAHEARATGWVQYDGMDKPAAVHGRFNMFVDEGDPHRKHTTYRLFFEDGQGHERTVVGTKTVDDRAGADVWSDTTTLYTRVLEGHREAGDDAGARVALAGILRLHPTAFLEELGTLRVEGPTAADRAAALARFGAFFVGQMWDVYATHFLSYAPF